MRCSTQSENRSPASNAGKNMIVVTYIEFWKPSGFQRTLQFLLQFSSVKFVEEFLYFSLLRFRVAHSGTLQVQGITLIVIKSFASQLLSTLRFLRKLHVIHCDLKPENILLQHPAMSKIKVIDFGSSCFNHERSRSHISNGGKFTQEQKQNHEAILP